MAADSSAVCLGVTQRVILWLLGVLFVGTPFAQQPLICPDGKGLCTWEDGWRPLWKHGVDDYWLANNGTIFVLQRGHQAPGDVVALSPAYKPVFIRQLEDPFPLEAVTGESAAGDLLFCQTSPAICDSYLSPANHEGLTRQYFPRGCLYPRVLLDGSAVCVTTGHQPRVLMRKSKEDVFSPVQGLPPMTGIEDVIAFGDGMLILSKWTDTSYFWSNETGITEIEIGGEARWVRKGEDDVFVGTHKYLEEEQKWLFSVWRLSKNLIPRMIWSSDTLVPRTVVRVGRDQLLIDAGNSDNRRLLRATLVNEAVVIDVLWEDLDLQRGRNR